MPIATSSSSPEAGVRAASSRSMSMVLLSDRGRVTAHPLAVPGAQPDQCGGGLLSGHLEFPNRGGAVLAQHRQDQRGFPGSGLAVPFQFPAAWATGQKTVNGAPMPLGQGHTVSVLLLWMP